MGENTDKNSEFNESRSDLLPEETENGENEITIVCDVEQEKVDEVKEEEGTTLTQVAVVCQSKIEQNGRKEARGVREAMRFEVEVHDQRINPKAAAIEVKEEDSDIMAFQPAKRSARSEIIPIRVFIYDGEVERRRDLIETSSLTRVCDLPNHPDLKKHIGNDRCEWTSYVERDNLNTITISGVSGITEKRPIQLKCTVKK
ncbi:hypothetical protein PFISCL1PPCAC_11401 [Pristionchus fissidentatus]|uniref:Uncharacterized protein n=1 Tax=Pristionchus fissidentatus TaxID=1538716 RepID=A0AAV5VKQ8_9BILA|nr:hypothetical protein PFISCL1PPCAC_11401 [Pristionchus fissidentatus]